MISLDEPTRQMRAEAASAGFYKSAWSGEHPRLQLLTIRELMDGKRPSYPAPTQTNVTLKTASKAKGAKGENLTLLDE